MVFIFFFEVKEKLLLLVDFFSFILNSFILTKLSKMVDEKNEQRDKRMSAG